MMKYASISTIAVLMMCSAAAIAASPLLKGDYAFSGQASCLYSGGPFTSGLAPTVWPGFPFSLPSGNGIFSDNFSVEGVRKFNGDGTGTVKGRTVEIVGPPSINPRASVGDFTMAFTYTVDGAGGYTTAVVPGSLVITSVAPTAGQITTQDVVSLDGLIGNNSYELKLASTDAVVETQTAQNFAFVPASVTGGAPITVRYRICARSRSLSGMGN
jgi:hypothetical protein